MLRFFLHSVVTDVVPDKGDDPYLVMFPFHFHAVEAGIYGIGVEVVLSKQANTTH
jgi:hypothetical protein